MEILTKFPWCLFFLFFVLASFKYNKRMYKEIHVWELTYNKSLIIFMYLVFCTVWFFEVTINPIYHDSHYIISRVKVLRWTNNQITRLHDLHGFHFTGLYKVVSFTIGTDVTKTTKVAVVCIVAVLHCWYEFFVRMKLNNVTGGGSDKTPYSSINFCFPLVSM